MSSTTNDAGAGAAAHAGEGTSVPDRMPRGVRRAVLGVLAGITLLGLYLIAVRGPALLVDLATGIANAFCF